MFSTLRQSHDLQLHGTARVPSPALPQNPKNTDQKFPFSSASPPRVSLLQINEILYSVFLLLDQKTLKTVVYFVCRRWRFVATRYIIRTLHMHHDNRKLLQDLPRRLLSSNALEVGPRIRESASARISPEEAFRSNEMLDQLNQALEQIQFDVESSDHPSCPPDRLHLQDLEDSTGRLRIQILTLNLQVPRKPDHLLSLINPSNLRELTVDFDFSTDGVYLGAILDLCSNLLRLDLSSRKVIPISRYAASKSNAKLHPGSNHEDHRPHPLRSLHIAYIHVLLDNLQTYFPRLGKLTELHFVEQRFQRRNTIEGNTLLCHEARQIFWETLAQECPLLESLHFPVHIFSGCAVPVKLFPRVHDYCVDYRDYTVAPLLEGILDNGFEDRLTTLKIVAAIEGDISPDELYLDDEVDDLMYRLLCSAPQLVHLITGPCLMSSNVLWGYNDQLATWACRRLKTLSLALDKDCLLYRDIMVEARHVFAHVSRCCPELEELRIETGCPGLSLKSGLCLLTRLRNLQSLTVKGDFLINDPPDLHELAWIQSPSSPAIFQTSSTSKWVSMFLQGSSAKDAPSLLEEAYLHCIERAQSLGDDSDTKDRLRMQQQQWDNQFCSEYTDQAFPMVDGLVDMEFSGSYLDIEACLQAQLFRLRRLQHLQALSSSGPQDDDLIKELGEAAKAAEVWPHMKKICLVHDYPTRIRRHRWYRRALTPPWHLEEKGSRMLQDLRPDITILRQG